MKEYKFYLIYNTVETEINGIDGWDNIGKEFERSKKYHTPFRAISAKLRFLITDGGSIIKDAYYNNGIDSIISFRVEKYNHITDDYDTYYTTIVDLKPENVEITNDFVECNLIDSSKENRFVVNDSVNFNVFSRTAIDGSTVPALTNEVQTISFKVPDIYLETIGTTYIGINEDVSFNINEEIVSGTKDYKVPYYVEEVATWDELYGGAASFVEADNSYTTEKTAIIPDLPAIISEQLAVDQLSAFVKCAFDAIIYRYQDPNNTEYTPAQRDKIDAIWLYNQPIIAIGEAGYVEVTEEIHLYIDDVDNLLCSRVTLLTQTEISGGNYNLSNSGYQARMNDILELLGSNFTGSKKVELIPIISLRYKGMVSVDIVSYPLVYFKIYDNIVNPQSTYLTSPVFTKDENTDFNKIGTSQKLFFKNEVVDELKFTAEITGQYYFKFIAYDNVYTGTTPYLFLDSISLDPNYSVTLNINFKKYNASNELLDTTVAYTNTWAQDSAGAIFENFTLNISENLTLNINEYYNLEFECIINGLEGISNSAKVNLYHNLEKNITVLSQVISNTAIDVRGLSLFDAMYRLIQLATGESDAAKVLESTIISNGAMKDIFVTSGYLLRNFTAGLNLSIEKLFQTIDTLGCLALGYNRTTEKYWIEGRMAGFKDESYSKIGEVKELKIKLDEDAFVNQISIGHDKVRYDYLNGANEYNAKTEYVINTPIKNELKLEQPYRTDTIGIALQLLNQYSASTGKDMSGDSDIFLIKVENGEAKQNGANWTGFLGIDTYYNGEFIARDVLKKHILSTQFKRLANAEYVTFIKSDFTKEVLESAASKFADLYIDDLPTTDLIPEKYIMQAAISNAVIEEINTDPNKFLDLKYLGVPFQGWIKSVKRSDYKGIANVELYAREYSLIADTGFDYTLPITLE